VLDWGYNAWEVPAFDLDDDPDPHRAGLGLKSPLA
jgi:hypothetical protein